MKPFIADLHMHTIMSGHAFGTVREMAAAAAERGLQIIGTTEHGPGIPGTCDPIYFRNICDAPRSLYGVEMLYGSEVNILNDGILSLDDRHLRYLDYAIAGIHLHCYDNSDIVTNTDNVIRVMEKSKVKFISHPDDSKIPLDYPALVQGAKATGTALEVMSAVHAQYLVASFPTRTLGGRNVGMEKNYSDWMESHMPENRTVAARFTTDNELYYVLKENSNA
jgi:putative hydrolase